ncbi:D-alpha,beta-D-heptose 1,7-bisphosphate phosphatase [Vreelandella songnenensis]|uniref:D,D-heptose 1,7-bisphosphate phosphatase n=1 Tax=Vreelandella songnenensis TaxID=1176243 RepID=A0A2T0V3I4_9GAMM|nr:D-glycero-beta-D-manno-heptose 1,7-bisphosphate 7-phosphatase [Halomonas songnenensis]PRY64733.1 D-alpha,beta-D-heptose 1,7-bisphosphate phosphatase [Halomonas songnenensis]
MPIAPQQLVILDRDGVINQDSDAYIKSLEEWIPYPTAINAIARLSQAGFTVAVATNQSGIARGYYSEAELDRMHTRMNSLVEEAGGCIAHIAYCPHGPDDACRCRKPLPGLLHDIQQALALDSLAGSWMVGDSLRDLQAGEACGCRTVLVKTGKGEKTAAKGIGLEHTLVCADLAEFVDTLLAGTID